MERLLLPGVAKSSSSEALTKVARAGKLVDAVTKRADNVEERLGNTQMLVSARAILNVDDFKAAIKPLKGETIFVRSYSSDPDGYFLCRSIWARFRPTVNSKDECGLVPFSVPPVTTIEVLAPTDEAMKQLAAVMLSAGILSGGVSSAPYGNVPHSPVNVVFVGVRAPQSLFAGPIRQPNKAQADRPRKPASHATLSR